MTKIIPPEPFIIPELWAALVARYERPFTIAQPTWWTWLNAKHAPPIGKLPEILRLIGIPIPEAVTALNWDAVLHTLSRAQLAHEIALARRDGRLAKRKALQVPEPTTPEERLAGIIQWCLNTRRVRTVGFHKLNMALKRKEKMLLMTEIEKEKFLSNEADEAAEAARKRGACKARRAMIEDLERVGQTIPRDKNGNYDYKAISRLLGVNSDPNPTSNHKNGTPVLIDDLTLADI